MSPIEALLGCGVVVIASGFVVLMTSVNNTRNNHKIISCNDVDSSIMFNLLINRYLFFICLFS